MIRGKAFTYIRFAWPALACFGWATGCEHRGEGAGVVRRDSSGVEIIETRQAQWTSAEIWHVDAEPELSIGLTEGDESYLFGDIAGAIRLDDGRVVVADGQSREVRFYDSAGRFVQKVGGRGSGPGELNSVSSLWRCGPDRIYAHDLMRSRVVGWQDDARLSREFDLLEPTPERRRGPYRSICSRSGEFLVAGWGDTRPLTALRQSRLHSQRGNVWLLDTIARPLLKLGEFTISERVFLYNAATGGGSSAPHPFGRAASFALTADRVHLGTAEQLEVRSYDRTGRLVRIVRGPTVDVSIDEAVLDRYQTTELAGFEARLITRMRELDLPLPLGLPAFTDMRVDPDGHLWLERFQFPWERAGRWAVFSENGVFLGHVELPAHFTVHEIGRDYVLGVTRDEFDVERIRVHRLHRPD